MNLKNRKGFTLVEVVIVLTVMALLAVAALPRIINIITQAKKGSRDNIIAAVREGIMLQKVSSISENAPLGAYPANLDTLPMGGCNVGTGCFVNVLEPGQGITDFRWGKAIGGPFGTTYNFMLMGDPAAASYSYNATNGTLLCVSGAC